MLKSRDTYAFAAGVFFWIAVINVGMRSVAGVLLGGVLFAAMTALWWGHAKRDQRTKG